MGERFDSGWRILLLVVFLVGVGIPLGAQGVSTEEPVTKAGQEDKDSDPSDDEDSLSEAAVGRVLETEGPEPREVESKEAVADTTSLEAPAEGVPMEEPAIEGVPTEGEALPPASSQEADSESAHQAPEVVFLTVPLEDHGEPGEHHDHLSAGIGSWDVVMKIWHSPNSPVMELFGTSESRWILGGRFVETRFHGQFMGQSIDGLGIDGYDNQKQKYVGTWRDTLGTHTMVFEGACEGEGSTRTMVADFVDPASGKAMTNKGVTTMLDADTYRYESFLRERGSEVEFKNLELTARRQ